MKLELTLYILVIFLIFYFSDTTDFKVFKDESSSKYNVEIIDNTEITYNKNCEKNFYKNTPPYTHSKPHRKYTYPLCFTDYNVMYSGITKTPLWTSQHLNTKKILSSPKEKIDFHHERRIPIRYQPIEEKYDENDINYIYKPWQLSPYVEMSNEFSNYESHSLANISPAYNPSKIYNLEQIIRDIALKNDLDIYIITGSIYSKSEVKYLKNNILIPDHLFKAIYIPTIGLNSAYYISNDAQQIVKVVSLCYLEEITSINLFPTLKLIDKKKVYNLPTSNYIDIKDLQKILKIDNDIDCSKNISTQELQKNRNFFGKNIVCYGKYCEEEENLYKNNYSLSDDYEGPCNHMECLEGENIICNPEKCRTLITKKIIPIESCKEIGNRRTLGFPYGVYNLSCFDKNNELIYEIDID
ncbi:hypothetical protein GFH30_08160 [Acinetobacter wanghuae]|uniref:DNA/RNA non-specific endonuclease n=1 Tax=Acinetobacter wanghuae TaxID=2662362 RepID=A0A5Q0P2F6_9GAMM|nr:DNA/RNA non-specific endonuclease [Acinetobacter wanghuae]MQW91084.1 hypothetical protein [Acinetobacter wanghuae]QGA11367.1 hypothetical protein GFH30_08160 [Acinetobacter wanghuae]